MLQLALVALLCQTPAARSTGVPIGQGKVKPKVTVTAPRGGWSVDRMLLVEGTVSDTTVDPVVLSINGDRFLMRTFDGRFSRKFPAAAGKNVVTVMATNQGGTTQTQVTTWAQIPPVPLKVVLTSDTDGVYTDLHIYEPTDTSVKDGVLTLPEMAHVYWSNTESPSGGTFFLNEQGGDFDQPGYGPYLYIHRAPPKGVYLVTTNYWPSGDKAHTVATLNVTLFEGTPREVKRVVRTPLATHGTTAVLVWIRIVDAGSAQLYVPEQDPPPGPEGWPKNLAQASEVARGQGSGEGE